MRHAGRAVIEGCRDERGIVLPLALIALVLLFSLAGALLAVGSSETSIAANHVRGIQSQYLAEAGIEDAFNAFRDSPATVALAPATLTTVPGLSGASPALATQGSYTVQYQRAGGNTIRVISTGISADGTGRTVLTAVFTNNFTIDTAILTGGNFSVSGNPRVQGTCGSVFTDGNLSVSGNPNVASNLLASGTYTATGQPVVGGTAGGGRSTKPVPNVNPADFLTAARSMLPANQVYQMKANGQILDGNNNVITTLTSGLSYRGWAYTAGSPASWGLQGNTGYDGTYYLEGDASIHGNPGSSTTPWNTSIIATGNITVAGNPEISAHLTDTLFVAGLDLQISGNPTLSGLVAAHEQISITGNATLNGYVIAQGATSTSGLITQDAFGGNPTITYNCGGTTPPLAAPLRIIAWGR